MKNKPRANLPKGWTKKAVKELAARYETQSEDEATAEDEAAYENVRTTMMEVPVELVPKVQRLIAKRAS